MGQATHNISAECSREPRDWAHANIGTQSISCITRLASESLYPHSKFQHNASSRCRDTEKGHARSHVQAYPILGLC